MRAALVFMIVGLSPLVIAVNRLPFAASIRNSPTSSITSIGATTIAAASLVPAALAPSHRGLETRPGNPQLLHLVDQRRALQAKFGGCPFRAPDHPTDSFKRVQNQSAFRVPQSSCSRRDEDTLSPCLRQRIGKHAIV